LTQKGIARTVDPIVKTRFVRLPVEEAFGLFTERLAG
jgi:hypothetical protein